MKTLFRTVTVLVLAVWGATATAAPIAFEIAGGSAKASGFAAGTVVDLKLSKDLTSEFTLDVGQSKTINFLDISVSGSGLALGLIEATLNFTDPLQASANGLFVGLAVVLNKTAGGVVSVLDNPGTIAFGNGGLFGVTFNGFEKSCQSCSALSGTVTATVSLLKAPHGVPEPATLTLLGAGLAAFAFGARRRRQRNS